MSTIQADLKKYSVDVKKELKELQKLERIQLRNPADRQSVVSYQCLIMMFLSTYTLVRNTNVVSFVSVCNEWKYSYTWHSSPQIGQRNW